MKKKIGIWIDHREAFLVSLEGGETKLEHIDSNAESNVRAKGGWKAAGTSMAQSVSKEQTGQERRKHQLHNFYQAVIKITGEAENIYIFGPGEARNELAKEFGEIMGRRERVAAVEASDNLTENQIVAKVKSFFSVPEDRRLS